MENVASDLLQHYPLNPPPPFAEGEVNCLHTDREELFESISDSKYGCTFMY